MQSNTGKRILIVTDLWTTHPNGLLTVVSNLKRELEALGHSVDLIEPGQFRTIPFFLYPEVRIPLFARGKVRRMIMSGRYDHVHIETEGMLGWHARSVCKRRGIRFTTAFNGQLDLYAENWLGKPFGRMVHAYLRSFHSAATLTLVSTDALKAELARDYALTRVAVCEFGIDPVFFGRGTCPTQLEKPVFMYFGRVSSEKSIEEFLNAPLPGTKVVIGDGPDRKRLEAEYPGAHFTGFQTGQSLIDWLSCVDVFVMPSRTETFGLVIAEALAQGIPVAAHDVTGPREIIQNGLNGYLDEDLARAATKCLTLSSDACRESVKRYSWRMCAERFIELVAPLRGGTSD
jgi:glycosyltransferase involved in cell wall biosynthesis